MLIGYARVSTDDHAYSEAKRPVSPSQAGH
jgi:hypothetical protein